MNTDPRSFAIERHGYQVYNGTVPYAYHLAQVEAILHDYGMSSTYWTGCAWLHDVLEDTPTSVEELRYLFGDDIAITVARVSGFGENRHKRNLNIYGKIRADASGRAAIVKMADRTANLEALIRWPVKHFIKTYLSEKVQFQSHVVPLGHSEYFQGRLDRAYIKLEGGLATNPTEKPL